MKLNFSFLFFNLNENKAEVIWFRVHTSSANHFHIAGPCAPQLLFSKKLGDCDLIGSEKIIIKAGSWGSYLGIPSLASCFCFNILLLTSEVLNRLAPSNLPQHLHIPTPLTVPPSFSQLLLCSKIQIKTKIKVIKCSQQLPLSCRTFSFSIRL